MNIQIGNKWQAVECTDIRREVEKVTRNGITDTGWVNFIYLKCACGKEWRIKDRDYTGRKNLKDCGCGAAVGKAMENRKTVSTIYVGMRMFERVRKYAGGRGISMGKAWEELAMIGLGTLDLQDEG